MMNVSGNSESECLIYIYYSTNTLTYLLAIRNRVTILSASRLLVAFLLLLFIATAELPFPSSLHRETEADFDLKFGIGQNLLLSKPSKELLTLGKCHIMN